MKKMNPNSEKHPIAIGYWKDREHPLFPDPVNFVNMDVSRELRNIVATYLENGKVFLYYLGFSWCRFNCGIEDHEMGAGCFTDGDYVWPEGLSHYVRKHEVWLPAIFIEHVLQNLQKDNSLVDFRKLDLHDFSWWQQFASIQ